MAGAKRRVNIAGGSPAREAVPRADEETPGEDAALFREAVRDVRPLAHDRQPPQHARPPARARFARADRLAILAESLDPAPEDPGIAGGETSAFARSGVQASVLRRLRRGHYRVQAEIDLHGLTVGEAKSALREFLAEALWRGLTCVRVVHGKGLGSGPRGPVLKSAVAGILKRSAPVLAFVSARSVDGGTGALYALLARGAPPTGRPPATRSR
ncbi:MAG TPA: Smr/MutS family protein [Steroidobacteraceae bacterium]|nr:Smr/MutS family protein [Steroidobacteraceae bacterium]